MLTSIKKFTKTFLAKVLIGIIILPFLFWGMGDVFNTGNQNVIVTIDKKKISVQEFVSYLGRLNLNEKQRQDLKKTDLFEKILSDYIGKKIIVLEINDLGVKLTDSSLRNIVISDATFFKDGKFSRTVYEKFLLESQMSAPLFEQNIAEQEKKRQLLKYLSEGTDVPNFLIEKSYKSENQIKKIEYLDLDDFYKNILIEKKEIQKIYDENKQFFLEEFKKINYVELTPVSLTGQNDYSESYYKKIDEIENSLLDGVKLEEFVKKFNLKITTIDSVNKSGKNKFGTEITKIDKKLFSKIYNKQGTKISELISHNNKYFLNEVKSVEKIARTLSDKKVADAITSQIKIKKIIEKNTEIIKKISEESFKKKEMYSFAEKKNIQIKEILLKNIKDETIFNKDIIKEIFKIKDGEIQLITNSLLTKNFLILSVKTENVPFDKKNKDYEKFKLKAKLNLANQIFTTYDQSINGKYKVEINQKTISRIKNDL
jgi:peptidyl-prolyl cis-trans isomerase D